MKLLLVISADWYFCSHRLPIAVAAVKQGWSAHLACQVAACRDEIEAAGIVLHHVPLRRGSINPLFDLGYLWRLIRLYRREKPDVVHHVAMKPCLYGSLAAWICRVPRVVNALAGMGFLFSSSSLAVRLIRRPVLSLFRLLFNRRNGALILQNPDDIAMFQERIGVLSSRIRMIRGSGVDLNVFNQTADCRLQTLGREKETTDCRLQTLGREKETADYRLQTVDLEPKRKAGERKRGTHLECGEFSPPCPP